jgi:hypothetical protein
VCVEKRVREEELKNAAQRSCADASVDGYSRTRRQWDHVRPYHVPGVHLSPLLAELIERVSHAVRGMEKDELSSNQAPLPTLRQLERRSNQLHTSWRVASRPLGAVGSLSREARLWSSRYWVLGRTDAPKSHDATKPPVLEVVVVVVVFFFTLAHLQLSQPTLTRSGGQNRSDL